ncbi:hypothetical protein CDD81_4028 [Ophiocordyceps australis]|uniref:Thioesterase domain-containing protein n=1 Tax=Ophiocordyceps australis TaxID=1399860 RepID=A0A2C5YAN0_9HYPO|nr:hypothetical protein CDD81_4028 [Ophiocordyceps australis]
MPVPSSPDEDVIRTNLVQRLLARLVSASPIYASTLSTLALSCVERGLVLATLTLTPVHVNSRGSLHGAVSATIVDLVTGLAIASWDGRGSTGASVDMHLSYLSTAAVGDEVQIEARAQRVGGSLAFVTVRIMRGQEVVTLGQHTKYVKGTAPALV